MDDTDIVRCKDCVHRPVQVKPFWYSPPKKDFNGHLIEDTTCPYVDLWDTAYTDMPMDYWFCCHGERSVP